MMKKVISALLTAFLLINLCAWTLPVFGEESTDSGVGTVYLSGAGDDSNNGSRNAPVTTLLAAYRLLGANGGTIVVIGDVVVEGEYRQLCDFVGGLADKRMGQVVITSESDAVLTIAGEGIWFLGETVFEKIHLHFTYTGYNSYLVANCQKLTIGEDVEVTIGEGVPGYPIIYGSGFYSFMWIAEGTSSDVTVKSGTWAAVYGGGGANGRGWGTHIDDVPGDAHVTITGGTIDTVYGAGNGGVGGTDPVLVHGNVELNIHGGTVNHVIANGATSWAPVRGNVTVTITGGDIQDIKLNLFDGSSAVDGTVRLLCNNSYRALAQNFPEPEPLVMCGAQTTSHVTDGSYAVRFIAALSSLDYEAVGFEIDAVYGNGESKHFERSCNYVYTSVTGNGVEYEAKNFGGEYLIALHIIGIPVEAGEVTYTVRPYTQTAGGEKVYAPAGTVTLGAPQN